MNTKTFTRAGLVLLVLALSGCSTFVHGNFEKIRVISTPSKALCKMYRESEGYMKSVATPNAVYLQRSTEPVRIVCSKKGYKTIEVIAAPIRSEDIIGNVGGWVYGPAILGGMMVDAANQSTGDLPEVVSVTLEPK